MGISERFWNSSMDEMKQGFVEGESHFLCLLCDKKIEKGIIYPVGEVLYEAKKFIMKHIQDEHGSVFNYLNSLDKKLTGLSEHQSRLLGLFYEGKSDSEVQKIMGIGSASTIRNHRFALKEKEKQARSFMVMMELLKERNKNAVSVVSPHKTATMIDDRYNVTEDENEKLINKYFPEGPHGRLKTFSMQEKHKIVVLREILKRFEVGKIYSEREINDILKTVYEEDYAVIRKYLIEYGFLARKKDCSEYWVKESSEERSLREGKDVISGVYQIRNTQNGKVFVTSGRNISKLNGIKFELNFGNYKNKALQEEWKQYGEEAFVFEILESFKEDENAEGVTRTLKRLEKKWIDKLQPFGEKGYNKH